MQVVIADAVLSNDRIARSIGLNVVDLQTLGVVMRAGAPMTPAELSAATGMPSSSTTRVLDRLQARGYVSRTHDAQDRRRVLVTVAGPRLIAELQAHYIPIVEQMERVHAQFSPDELAVALRYLRAIAAG